MLKHFRSGKKRIRTLWWILTIGTVASFIGLFVFRSGTGVDDPGRQASAGDVIGKVGGAEITQAEYVNATQAALAQYKAQYGQDPSGRDEAVLREQVWSNLVTQKALSAEARKAGIGVTDPEIVFAIHNTPPQDIATNPAFQTNGRFDPSKWQQALSDPGINWFPLEQRMRDELPGQRLEERMIAGVKISEPELRRLYLNQYEKAQVTAALVPLDATALADSSKLNDAALRAYYDAHRADFSGPDQVKAEVASIPRSVSQAEQASTKADMDQIVRDLRGGADFAQAARDQGEGPFADKGGDLGQDIALNRLPPSLTSQLAKMKPGDITEPMLDNNAYFIFKLVSRSEGPNPTVHLAEIQKTIHPSAESLQKDEDRIQRLRKEAASGKLAEAAARQQLVSVDTGWFAEGEFVPSLIQFPQVQRWAIQAKKGEVSRAFANEVGWIVAQVTDRRPAGPRPFDQVKTEVRSALELSLRQARPMQTAARIVDAVKAGKSLEQAAQEVGAQVVHTQPFTRTSPAPQIAAAPRAVGLAFGLTPGDVGGPVASPAGALVLRKDAEFGGTPAQFDSLKGSLSQTLLQTRQRRYVSAWLNRATQELKVSDLRPSVEADLTP